MNFMKKKGFIFTELIVVMGVFSVIIFPMIMLMNKNIKIVQNLRTEYEITKTAGNIENILINLAGKDRLSAKYFLEFDKKRKTAVLKNGGGEITVLRNIQYLSYGEIEISEKKIFFPGRGKRSRKRVWKSSGV